MAFIVGIVLFYAMVHIEKETLANYEKKTLIVASTEVPEKMLITEENIDRYVPNQSQTITVSSGKTSSVSFYNILKKFRVTVTKQDYEKGHAQGDAKLGGAVYGLYKGDELIAQYTTDSNGSVPHTK